MDTPVPNTVLRSPGELISRLRDGNKQAVGQSRADENGMTRRRQFFTESVRCLADGHCLVRGPEIR